MSEAWFTYEFAKDFQSAMVGIIGFGGIVGAQFLNAYLTRAQENRNLDARRQAVCTAVLTELKMFRSAFKTTAKGPSAEISGTATLGRLRRTLSVSLSADLGLIPKNALSEVFDTLMIIDEYEKILILLAFETTEHHFFFSKENFNSATTFASQFIEQKHSLSKAIALLEPHV